MDAMHAVSELLLNTLPRRRHGVMHAYLLGVRRTFLGVGDVSWGPMLLGSTLVALSLGMGAPPTLKRLGLHNRLRRVRIRPSCSSG